MLDVVLSGFKLLRNTYKAVRECKARLNEALEEVSGARRALDYVRVTQARLEESAAQGHPVSAELRAALDGARRPAHELSLQVRRKERLLLPLSRMVARLTRLFAGISRQASKARLAARGAHGILERALQTLARAEARATGQLEELESKLKSAKAGRYRATELGLLDEHLPPFLLEVREELGALLEVAEAAADKTSRKGTGEPSSLGPELSGKLPRSLPAPDAASLEAVLHRSLALAQGRSPSPIARSDQQRGSLLTPDDTKKLLGAEFAEEAGRLYAAGCEAAGLSEDAASVPLAGLACLLLEHAAENWGFQMALAAHRLAERLAQKRGAGTSEDSPLLAQVGEISGMVLPPLALLATRVGLLFAAATLPAAGSRDGALQNLEKHLMDELVEVARDIGDGLLEGELNMGALLQVDTFTGAAAHGLQGLSEAFSNMSSLLDAANIDTELEKVRALRKKARKVADGLYSALTTEAAFGSLNPPGLAGPRSADPDEINRHVKELAVALSPAERTHLSAQIIYSSGGGEPRSPRMPRSPRSPRSPHSSPGGSSFGR